MVKPLRFSYLLELKLSHIKSPYNALKYGIALIPEDRKSEGVILGESIKDNVSLASFNKVISKFGFINKNKEHSIVDRYMKELAIKAPDIDTPVKNLSGGNQQKVVIAKCTDF